MTQPSRNIGQRHTLLSAQRPARSATVTSCSLWSITNSFPELFVDRVNDARRCVAMEDFARENSSYKGQQTLARTVYWLLA